MKRCCLFHANCELFARSTVITFMEYNTGTQWQTNLLRKSCSADCFKVMGKAPEGQI